MERTFNTAGPQKLDKHYSISPLTRFNLKDILSLINQERYFVLHAPRQTGKTSCLFALRDYLNKQDNYFAVYVNVEGGQSLRNDVGGVVKSTIDIISNELDMICNTSYQYIRDEVQHFEPASMFTIYLTRLSRAFKKPLVLLIDEIDALVGDSLVSVLRQLRAGYPNRPTAFPQSVILCGVRDVRDYRIVLSNQDIVTGGSAFNIKAKSLRLGNFSKEEIHELFMQHTHETGQEFDEACFPIIWDATEGQPWLVNAIGQEVTSEMEENRDRSVIITPEMIERAIENIIYRRDTHIDILIDKLKEERVRRVIQPMLTGSADAEDSNIPTDDIQYVEDLGLIKRERGKPRRIANSIYREIIPRELTWSTQDGLTQNPAWYMNPDNSINMEKLLLDFQQFFRQNSDSWIGTFNYAEAGPQLLLQAFLQRIVNGGGYIDREYGLGRRRTDLLIRKPLTDGYGGPVQRIVLELKIRRGNMETVIAEGLEQTVAYMDLCGSVDEGHLIIFDRSGEKSWDERIWHELREYAGHSIMVWGM